MSTTDNKGPKGRIYELLLYPVSDNYSIDEVLGDAREYFNQWAYILHDSDIKDDGTLKEPHIHFYGYKGSSVFLTTILNRYSKIGVPPQDIELKNSWKGCIQYLIHQNHLEKFQYCKDDIVTNVLDLNKFLESKPEGLVVLDFADMRLSGRSYRQLILQSVKDGTYSVLRKNLGVIDLVVQEEFRSFLVEKEWNEYADISEI